MKSFLDFIKEEIAGTSTASVAGIGVGPDGEPGVSPKAHKKHKKKNKKEYRVALDMIS